MSLVIFFGTALLVFLAGVAILSVTFYHWYKESKVKSVAKNATQNAVDSKA